MASESDFGWNDDTDASVADTFYQAELGGTWGNLNLAASYLKAKDVKFEDFGLNGDNKFGRLALIIPLAS